jgi:hypothetical protein
MDRCTECNSAADVVLLDLKRGKHRVSALLCRSCCSAAISQMIDFPADEEILQFYRTLIWKDTPPMTYEERTALMKSLTPEQVGKTREDRNYRYTLLLLLSDIAGSLQTSAYSQREQLKILQARASAPAGKAPVPIKGARA